MIDDYYSVKRKRELSQEISDFYDKLDFAAKRYVETAPNTKLTENSIENNSLTSSPNTSPLKIKAKKKISISRNVLEPMPPWRVNKLSSDEFNKIKVIDDNNYYPTPLEIYRTNMSKRSYSKGKDTLDGRGFICRNLYSTDFNNVFKRNDDLSALGSLGSKIIRNFIKDNDKKEEIYREKEKEYYEYLHSKHDNKYKVWKSSMYGPEYFSSPPADKIVSFKKEKPKLIKIPFKPSKKTGTYFEKFNPLY